MDAGQWIIELADNIHSSMNMVNEYLSRPTSVPNKPEYLRTAGGSLGRTVLPNPGQPSIKTKFLEDPSVTWVYCFVSVWCACFAILCTCTCTRRAIDFSFKKAKVECQRTH